MSTFDPYGFWIFSITSVVVEIEGGSWKIDDLTDGQVERGTERGTSYPCQAKKFLSDIGTPLIFLEAFEDVFLMGEK